MLQEGIRNFKELRAKFQNTFDGPLLPGPVKSLADVSHKRYNTSAQSSQALANGKVFSSNQNQSSTYCPAGESQPLTSQRTRLIQSNQIQKCSTVQALQGGSSGSAINSQKALLLPEMNQSGDEITDKEKVMVAYNFKDKLWNWEKFTSQNSEMPSAIVLANFHLGEPKSTRSSPKKSLKSLETHESSPFQRHLRAQRKPLASCEESSFLLSQHNRKSLENHSPETKSAVSPSSPIHECELTSQVTEEQWGMRSHQLPKTKPLPSVESLGPPPPKPSKPPVVNLQTFQRQTTAVLKTQREAAVEDNPPPESAEFEEPHNYEATISYLRHSGNSINLCTTKEIADSTYQVKIEELQKVLFLSSLQISYLTLDECSPSRKQMCAYGGTPGTLEVTEVHRQMRGMPSRKQNSGTSTSEACHDDSRQARHTQGHCASVAAVEVTNKTPFRLNVEGNKETREKMYDDVACPEGGRTKPLSSNSLTSDSEENSDEVYEDVYKTKNNYPKIDLDGNETLKRLRQFFKKEKDRLKMRKAKSKENISEFSISMPDLDLRSREVIVYDDVDSPVKKSKLSPRHFFKTKKQNLEKKMRKEEKLFRERFEYDKEIIVINTAVACSNNSRKGLFDLPVSPGEELDVIDITEQNLVICRNSEGKYGYVLIDHLDFKHQSWSP
ncbi:FYN-binding protein 2 [Rhynchocyon petersi]